MLLQKLKLFLVSLPSVYNFTADRAVLSILNRTAGQSLVKGFCQFQFRGFRCVLDVGEFLEPYLITYGFELFV